MPKETKFTLALMLFLAVAFGFVVWQRVADKGDVIADLKEKAKQMLGKKDLVEKNHGQPETPQQNSSPFQEPRKLPFDSSQTAQVSPEQPSNPFGATKPQQNKPKNPFAQNQSTFVADAPPKDLFSEPTTGKKPQKQPVQKPDPFSPWTSKTKERNKTIVQKPINAFPASQTRTHQQVSSDAPKNPFLEPAQNKPGKSVTRNPFEQSTPSGNKQASSLPPRSSYNLPKSSPRRPADQTQKKPFNPFESNTQVQSQSSGKANLNSNPSSNQAQQQTQKPFDPFGSVSTNPRQTPKQQGFPGTSHQVNHHQNSQPGNANPFHQSNPVTQPKKMYTPVESSIPTRVYTVQPDESYWSISKKIYGTIRYFQALELHNQPRIASAKKLRPGMKVLVPEEKILLAQYARVIPGAGKSSNSSESEQTTQGLFYTASGQPMFRVGEEDTLSGIAHKHLGRTTRWVEIYNLNRDRIKTADRLKIGTVLRLPANASRIALTPNDSYGR